LVTFLISLILFKQQKVVKGHFFYFIFKEFFNCITLLIFVNSKTKPEVYNPKKEPENSRLFLIFLIFI